ncbi:outer envelope protein 61 [Gossypium australe]|uniref:Outer envelope protein 61 n=1 Tax=Gossypium australe TaxID=47621 RepID=A0A5B6X6D8_9ROSI|nr:outer envelope protein 61 [Gossypium australe]
MVHPVIFLGNELHKQGRFDDASEKYLLFLSDDGKNVKALYRRGQAYKELGQLEDAISDLSEAHEVYPGDETIADVLRDGEERLAREGSHQAPQGVAIEAITEEAASTSSATRQTSFTAYSLKQPRERTGLSKE